MISRAIRDKLRWTLRSEINGRSWRETMNQAVRKSIAKIAQFYMFGGINILKLYENMFIS